MKNGISPVSHEISSITQSYLTLAEINGILDRANSLMSGTEMHGLLCGFTCSGQHIHGRLWLDTVMGFLEVEEIYLETVRSLLIRLYTEIASALKSNDFSFQVLLPDEQAAPLDVRAKAIGEWCSGFLIGLRCAGVEEDAFQSEEMFELIYYIQEFSKMNYEEFNY